MDLRKLKKLIDLVQESGIAELEITEGEERVRIIRAGQPGATYMAMPQQMPMQAAPAATAPVAAAAPAAAAPVEGHVVKSPMVGTFYRSGSPSQPAFVDEGDRVEVGQTLCILEAMKLFNEFKAEHAGVIRKILVANAEPVEYGQPLFELEPA